MKSNTVQIGFVFLAGAALLGACSSLEKTGDADTVKVVDKVESYKCKFLGVVSGSFSTPWDSAENMVDGALREARSKASELQATDIILQGSPQILFNSESRQREAIATVNAYQCKK